MEHSEQDRAHASVRAQISLSCSPWRARGQHGAPAIAGIRYCLGACARAASRTSALSECCASAVALQTLRIAASKCSSRTIEAVADREVAAGSVSTGDPDLTSAARSGQPCPTHATRPGTAKTLALDHNNTSTVGTPFQPRMQQVTSDEGRARSTYVAERPPICRRLQLIDLGGGLWSEQIAAPRGRSASHQRGAIKLASSL